MKRILLPLFSVLLTLHLMPALAQESAPKNSEMCHCPSMTPVGKGSFYFGWGYNLDYYSKSDIHLHNNHANPDLRYDFTVYGVGAEDRPGLENIFNTDLAIPQYAFRIGYFFNKSKADWGIEINYDHSKYVAYDWQKVRVKGHLAGPNGGVDVNTDTILNPDTASGWFNFEHTNGANFALLDVVRRFSFYHTPSEKFWLSGMTKAGVGFMYPRTDATLFRVRRDDKFHVAGYMAGVELGLRADFLKHLYFETAGKLSWVNYTDILLPLDGRGNQKFWAYEYVFILGVQFPLLFVSVELPANSMKIR